MRARAVDGVLAVPQEGSGNLSREPWSGGLRLLPSASGFPICSSLRARVDEAAASQDDEGACEASGHVSRIGYRPETKELWELPGGSLSDPEVSFNALFGSGIWAFLLSVMCS